jgi:hypothetical protein
MQSPSVARLSQLLTPKATEIQAATGLEHFSKVVNFQQKPLHKEGS